MKTRNQQLYQEWLDLGKSIELIALHEAGHMFMNNLYGKKKAFYSEKYEEDGKKIKTYCVENVLVEGKYEVATLFAGYIATMKYLGYDCIVERCLKAYEKYGYGKVSNDMQEMRDFIINYTTFPSSKELYAHLVTSIKLVDSLFTVHWDELMHEWKIASFYYVGVLPEDVDETEYFIKSLDAYDFKKLAGGHCNKKIRQNCLDFLDDVRMRGMKSDVA